MIAFRVSHLEFVDSVIENFVPVQNRRASFFSFPPLSLRMFLQLDIIVEWVLFNNKFLPLFRFHPKAVSCCLKYDIYELSWWWLLIFFYPFHSPTLILSSGETHALRSRRCYRWKVYCWTESFQTVRHIINGRIKTQSEREWGGGEGILMK